MNSVGSFVDRLSWNEMGMIASEWLGATELNKHPEGD